MSESKWIRYKKQLTFRPTPQFKKEIKCIKVRLKISLQIVSISGALQKNFSKSPCRTQKYTKYVGVPQDSGTIVSAKIPLSCLHGPVLSKCEVAPPLLHYNCHVLLTPASQSHCCRLPELENVSQPNQGILCHFKYLHCHKGQKPGEHPSFFAQLLLAVGRALVPHFPLTQNSKQIPSFLLQAKLKLRTNVLGWCLF